MLLGGAACHAAGGHHAVDDATILDPGQCQLETWVDSDAKGHGAWHLGPACRTGAWELGLNLDGARWPGDATSRMAGVQGKWVKPLSDRLAVGVVLSANWQDGRYKGAPIVFPLTWQATPQLAVHVNAGRDLPREGHGRGLGGVAAEWAASQAWSFVAERFDDAFGRAARLGMRWQPTAALSVDLSRARAMGDERGAWWTVGVTLVNEPAR